MEFQWKAPPTKKARTVVSGAKGPEESKELILSIENSRIATNKPEVEHKPLVIPLVDSHNDSRHFAGGPKEALSLEMQAERELLAELTNSSGDAPQSSMVIQSAPVEVENGKKKSLLMALIDRHKAGEEQGGRLDLAAHASDLDFKSEIYQSVPVVEFGAALLRGMGWNGDAGKTEAEKKLEQRQRRLGLGAAPMPGPPGKDGRPTPAPAAASAAVVDTQKSLTKGALVQLEDGQRRAEVVLSVGVPGLNMLRLRCEGSGELVDVARRSVRLLTKEELLQNPYVFPAVAVEEEEPVSAEDKHEADPLKASILASASSASSGKSEVSKPAKSHSSKSSSDAPASRSWLRTGLRVKVISRKASSSQDAYLQKGSIVDVHQMGIATVRLDNGKLLDDVKEKYLETVLPSTGGLCMVLAGENKGEVARMMGRSDKDQTVTAELRDSLDVIVISMDDVCAFVNS